ncbi:MAG: carbamate kinase [Candidatus Pacebacteria bacterium]|nr:carbamate kinase [Candidatus Paceibacterota bacterium]
MNKLIVVALGGNAIKSAKQKGTNQEQFFNVSKTTEHLAKLVKEGYRLVITHGNGPQVGNLLIQHDAAKDKVPALPMDVCGAQSQGQIGYMISQTLGNHLKKLAVNNPVAAVVTQVEVDKNDPAFGNPTKPVGPFYDRKNGQKLKTRGFTVIEDAGRGYRRVVPSPQPKRIVEIDAIKCLVKSGAVVIASGGGGVPVIKREGEYQGTEAVIDKDLAGELLAEELKACLYIILTDVEKVSLNFNTENQQDLSELTLAEAEKYQQEGHFAPGSMAPKVRAATRFVSNTNNPVLITHPFKISDALNGKTGTRVIK